MSDVVSIPRAISRDYELKIVRPRSLNDMNQVVLALRANKAVILNLEQLEMAEAQRISDFAAGSTYAISGHQLRLGKAVFLFTPSNIKIQDRTVA
jgi:cell division inhibitor SepF